VSVKRHTARIATRIVALLVADVSAMFICAFVADIAASGEGWLATEFTRAAAAGYGSAVFGAVLFLSLVATGSYSRHRSLNGKLRLLAGSALACGFAASSRPLRES